jgi:tol-pal system protein YbgF
MSQQIRNITAMNMPQQISDLRQKVATLQGQLEVTERDLKIISAQQARFYEDLSHQIVALKSGSPSKPPQPPLSKNKVHLQQTLNDATTYQNAFKLLAQKNNAGAEKAFNQYLKQYPKGKFSANAHYWLGEIAYNNKQFDQSFAQFQTVVTKYPKSVKVAESKLKIAEIHAKKGKVTLAKIELKQIEHDYAHSTTAQMAQHQLKQLK